ncbi:hypothetical protein K470DRAFT_218288 [Piedraia hortae CBS 480.64]|uniref:HSF-type DNA-binding domain-containing protein n=1 Tax=Piedraia hortae CBS 480.64 TaxID=1314780 RepID=A0A6A7BXH8_9PEZI|nr:hypothetical protein K470DRAFT_218288 [Piedraia hortae CBS 480.64]
MDTSPPPKAGPSEEPPGAPNATNAPEPPPPPSSSASTGGASAAAAQQPKVVQTAFIHKLYSMLEDPKIQHLISWSTSNDSFVMSPSSDFAKVLAQYFKHGNISSFVRQLNIYGFHKVSDVFHTGSPDSALWEFRHGAGNFKRGDLAGLREIRRRASRHALIQRDSFTGPKQLPLATPTVDSMPDPDARIGILEWHQQDLHARLARTEEAYNAMRVQCCRLLDGLTQAQRLNLELSGHVLALVPESDTRTHRELGALRQSISRHIESLRDDSLNDAGAPASPRQRLNPSQAARMPIRGPVPTHVQAARQGSMSGCTYSPSRGAACPPPPPPFSSLTANLGRRHTFANIRVNGWQQGARDVSPHSTHNPSAWPSSPHVDQNLRDSLSAYELPQGNTRARDSQASSRQPSPPAQESSAASFASSFSSFANPNDAGWQIPGVRFPFRGLDTSRRSSMTSNVHSLLNPADTAECDEEESGSGPEERKRKRL